MIFRRKNTNRLHTLSTAAACAGGEKIKWEKIKSNLTSSPLNVFPTHYKEYLGPSPLLWFGRSCRGNRVQETHQQNQAIKHDSNILMDVGVKKWKNILTPLPIPSPSPQRMFPCFGYSQNLFQ